MHFPISTPPSYRDLWRDRKTGKALCPEAARRTTRALGARSLRSYVPLCCGPSESADAKDTGLCLQYFISSTNPKVIIVIFSSLLHILCKEVDKMERRDAKAQILNILARNIRRVIEKEAIDFSYLQEIRLRIDQPVRILLRNREKVLPSQGGPHIVTKEEVRETMEYISHYSLYAYENELRQGFLTIEGGHRVGVAGKVIMEKEKVKNIQYISSVNVRVSHEVIGCADRLLPFITKNRQVCHTLIISPPCCGKTTLIRDLIRQISDGGPYVKGCSVGVVDERSELGGCYLGVTQNHLGTRTDILDCCPKAEGMIMLIRSMSPQVIAVDEIGTSEDIRAIEYAMQCGCKLIASVHGLDMDEATKKPVLGELIRRRMFERYVVLGNGKHPGEIRGIYDERGSVLCRE